MTAGILCRNRCADDARGPEDKQENHRIGRSKAADRLQNRGNKTINRVVPEHGNCR